jgi:site-specific recombinase XerD
MISSRAASVGPLVQGFFLEHLLRYKRASLQTVSAYRDTFRLLLAFLGQRVGREPAALRLADFDAPAILAFLDHLERDRQNTARSRNARLAAIRSFARYVALCDPASLALVARVLAIPRKRTARRLVGYLTRAEMDACLAAPDRTRWAGRRDHALLLTLYNSGARVSELAVLRRSEVVFGASPAVQLHGKGRKDRVVPLWARTARVLPGSANSPGRPTVSPSRMPGAGR